MNSLCADAEKEAKLAMKGNERSAEALVHLDERFPLLPLCFIAYNV